ncbi:unnamed protein product [Bursaphelenchus xylophilus]|uniref:Peroxisomal membrane protein PEX14 n=1 Tax=Bursaphelenchus xylophilus TaxID=6326 RepID=A0A1I7RSF9_BURXY|nr:unnamed protein product [Bursaphelenchus xylophilus]CAG9122979.1 unnamed protein product [Bursaphelenchus xylophilus]
MADTSSSETALRPDFVENARRFLINPKVRSTPLEEQKKFLLGKGVTNAEINEALSKVSPDQLAANQAPLPEQVVMMHSQPPSRFISVLQNFLVMGGASYLAYKFIRSFFLPKFFDIIDPEEKERRELKEQLNELQNTTKFVMDTVSQTLETVATQQNQLNRALSLLSNQNRDSDIQRIQTDLSVIKSLFLRSDQFPQVPANLKASNSTNNLIGKALNGGDDIPSWQRKDPSNSNGSSDIEKYENAVEQ